MAADRDQLRSEVERVGTDCAAAKNRLASVESIRAGLEVPLYTTASFSSGHRYRVGGIRKSCLQANKAPPPEASPLPCGMLLASAVILRVNLVPGPASDVTWSYLLETSMSGGVWCLTNTCAHAGPVSGLGKGA